MRGDDPTDTVFFHLSENESLPSSRAAEEDSLHAWFTKFLIAEELDRQVDAERAAAKTGEELGPCKENFSAAVAASQRWATQTGVDKYTKVLNCAFTRLYCFTLSRLPAHYREGPELRNSSLTARQGRVMGVRHSTLLAWHYLTDMLWFSSPRLS